MKSTIQTDEWLCQRLAGDLRAAGKAERTVEAYTDAVKRLGKIKRIALADITENDVRSYLADLTRMNTPRGTHSIALCEKCEKCQVHGSGDMVRMEVDESCRGPGNDELSKPWITTYATDPGEKTRGPAENPARSENCEEVRDVLPEGRRRSRSTSTTYGNTDCASFAICSCEGVSGRASRCMYPALSSGSS